MRKFSLFLIFLIVSLSFNNVNAFIPIEGLDILNQYANTQYADEYRDIYGRDYFCKDFPQFND